MSSFELKKISGYARFATSVLLCGVAVDALSTMVGIGSYFLGPPPPDPENWSAAFFLLGVSQLLIGILSLVLLLLSAFGIVQWMYRSYWNLQQINCPGLKHSANWAITYWFIPLVNLVKPYELMKEVFSGSDPECKNDVEKLAQVKVPGFFPLWWGCWIICNVLGQLSFRMALKDDSGQLSGACDLIGSLSSIFSIVSALLLIKIVRLSTEMQEKKIPELKSI